jgi:hypothetical protein
MRRDGVHCNPVAIAAGTRYNVYTGREKPPTVKEGQNMDCVKNSVTWDKGCDFMDDTPRYTFEGRDPSYTIERFQVVIYTEKEREFPHDSKKRNFYYGYVRDNDKECADTIGRFRTLKEAKD